MPPHAHFSLAVGPRTRLVELAHEGRLRMHRFSTSGRRRGPRSPELDQVRVGIEEVGAPALGRVHVPRLLRTDGDLDALPPQVVDGAFEVGGVDLETEMETAGKTPGAPSPPPGPAQGPPP